MPESNIELNFKYNSHSLQRLVKYAASRDMELGEYLTFVLDKNLETERAKERWEGYGTKEAWGISE